MAESGRQGRSSRLASMPSILLSTWRFGDMPLPEAWVSPFPPFQPRLSTPPGPLLSGSCSQTAILSRFLGSSSRVAKSSKNIALASYPRASMRHRCCTARNSYKEGLFQRHNQTETPNGSQQQLCRACRRRAGAETPTPNPYLPTRNCGANKPPTRLAAPTHRATSLNTTTRPGATMAAPPTIPTIKQDFLAAQARQLAAPLAPSRAWRAAAADAPLSEAAVTAALLELNRRVARRGRRAHPPQAARHVAEQIDRLYLADPAAASADDDDGAPRAGCDFGNPLTPVLLLCRAPLTPAQADPAVAAALPDRWPGAEDPEAARYAALAARLRELGAEVVEARARTARLRRVAGLLAPFAPEDVQANLVTRGGEVEVELERMRTLLARVGDRGKCVRGSVTWGGLGETSVLLRIRAFLWRGADVWCCSGPAADSGGGGREGRGGWGGCGDGGRWAGRGAAAGGGAAWPAVGLGRIGGSRDGARLLQLSQAVSFGVGGPSKGMGTVHGMIPRVDTAGTQQHEDITTRDSLARP